MEKSFTKHAVSLAAFLGLGLIGLDASALWTSQTTIERVRAYSGSTRFDIKFIDAVASGCGTGEANRWVSIDSAYITSEERRKQIRELAISAVLSGRIVEVNTLSGCQNGLGKLDYISLK